MEKERAIEVLREAGIDVAEVDSLKNGKAVPGLKLGDSNISPIIYFKTIFDSVLSQFCEEHGVDKIAIIPNSTEEVLLLTDTSGAEEEMSAMIQEVNETTLSADDILSDHVYYFER